MFAPVSHWLPPGLVFNPQSLSLSSCPSVNVQTVSLPDLKCDHFECTFDDFVPFPLLSALPCSKLPHQNPILDLDLYWSCAFKSKELSLIYSYVITVLVSLADVLRTQNVMRMNEFDVFGIFVHYACSNVTVSSVTF